MTDETPTDPPALVALSLLLLLEVVAAALTGFLWLGELVSGWWPLAVVIGFGATFFAACVTVGVHDARSVTGAVVASEGSGGRLVE